MSTSSTSTHPVSVTHLVAGLVFLGAAAVWALAQAELIEFGAAPWMMPLVLVAAGAIGLVASVAKALRGGSRRSRDQHDEWADEWADDGGPQDTRLLG